MPEGDTVFRSAANLHRELAGQILTATDFRVPQYATVDLAGSVVRQVVPRGKHIVIRTDTVSIHSHLKMEGSWHLYRDGAHWRRPAYEARAVLSTDSVQAVGFSLGILDILEPQAEVDALAYLGPDLLGPDWDPDEAARRLRSQPDVPIFVALLDQRNLAGLGNVYANELCYLFGLLPTRPVADVPDLPRLLDRAQRAITLNRDRTERTLTGDLRPGRRTWVYGRDGKACLRCGTTIRRGKLGAKATEQRDTYWCPRDQT